MTSTKGSLIYFGRDIVLQYPFICLECPENIAVMTSTAVARYRAVFASSCSHDPSRIPRRFLTAFSHGYMTTPFSAKEGRRSYSSLSHSCMEDSILQKVTVRTISSLYRKGEPITMSTAHDLPSALIADAEMDIVLVGDSLAMVALGKEDTTQVGLEDMIHHCRSVTRGTRKSFTVSRALHR